jgi:hypothetical protein
MIDFSTAVFPVELSKPSQILCLRCDTIQSTIGGYFNFE